MIKTKILNYLKKAVIKEPIEIEIFVPENEQFGHYSTNVALKLAKKLKKSPLEIAEEIKTKLITNHYSLFTKIEVAPPGFINFWISEKVLQNELKEILKKKQNYGKSAVKGQMSKVQIEFISANPTGPLTLANGRGGFMGDVLSNILEFCGYKVEREYYVNDTGNQILTLGKSILATNGFIKNEENFYKGGYVKEWAKKHKAISKKYQNNPLKLGQLAAADFLKEIKKAVEKEAKIKFDRWTSEDKHIHKKSYIDKVLKIFKAKKLIYEKDGALWLKTTDFNDEKDRVLITQDKFPTYFLADAGHFLETKSRGFNSKIMILGPDHHGYVKRIQAAAKIIGLKELKVIVTQAVRLMSAGKEVKMSKRTGEFVTFEDLIKEVKPDAARFFFLTHSPETHMDFDLDLAKERSMKNPVYYAQYAAVRCQGIIKKVNIRTSDVLRTSDVQKLNTAEDINLMRQMARFPEAVEEAAKNYNPQILARYALDLAREFHNFYEKERIIPARRSLGEGGGEEKNLMLARLVLIRATLIIFKNLFGLLGIGLPDKM